MKKKVSRSVELAQKAKVYSNTHSGEMLPDASFSKKLIKGNDQIVLGRNPSAGRTGTADRSRGASPDRPRHR